MMISVERKEGEQMGENTKNFALRAYRTEAEALERLAELKGVSQNEIINDLIARAYCEVDAIASRHKITGRLDGFSETYYFFEGVLIKLLGIPSTGEPMKEYRRRRAGCRSPASRLHRSSPSWSIAC